MGIQNELLDEEHRLMGKKPVHPGTVFVEDVMKPLGLTVTDTARMLGVSRKTLSEFIHTKSSLSPEMALRISKATNTSAESWMSMQGKLSLWNARKHEPKNVTVFSKMKKSEVGTCRENP